MVHPFFDALRYPWHRKEANDLYKELVSLTPRVAAAEWIDFRYIRCAADLPLLNYMNAPGLIWKEALDNLTPKRGLQTLCENVKKEYDKNTAVQDVIRAVENAQAVVDMQILSDESDDLPALVLDRKKLRDHLTALLPDSSPVKVVLVRGGPQTGKSHGRYLFEAVAKDQGR